MGWMGSCVGWASRHITQQARSMLQNSISLFKASPHALTCHIPLILLRCKTWMSVRSHIQKENVRYAACHVQTAKCSVPYSTANAACHVQQQNATISNPHFEKTIFPGPEEREMHRNAVGVDRWVVLDRKMVVDIECGRRGLPWPRDAPTMRVRTLPPVIVIKMWVSNVGPRGGGKEAIVVRIRVGGDKAKRGEARSRSHHEAMKRGEVRMLVGRS